MGRSRDLAFALALQAPRANWLDLTLRIGGHTETIRASGVVDEDPVAGLVRLAWLAASGRDGEAHAYFWLEPAGYWLTVDAIGDRTCVSLTFAPAMHPDRARDQPRAAERLVASRELGRRDLALVIWRAVKRAEADIAPAQNTETWTHAYPTAAMKRLRDSLR